MTGHSAPFYYNWGIIMLLSVQNLSWTGDQENHIAFVPSEPILIAEFWYNM